MSKKIIDPNKLGEEIVKVLKTILCHQDFVKAKFDISWYDKLNS